MSHLTVEADRLENLKNSLPAFTCLHAGVKQGQLDILRDGPVVDQVEGPSGSN